MAKLRQLKFSSLVTKEITKGDYKFKIHKRQLMCILLIFEQLWLVGNNIN
jgi:hypothetical protein